MTDSHHPIRVCFVCLGNICRSPTAEAVMRHLLADEQHRAAGAGGASDLPRIPIEVESAGTGDWHVGEPRDRRSSAVGQRRGIPLSGRARQFVAADFARFDHVVAMDRKNLEDLKAMAPDAPARAKLSLLRAYATTQDGHAIAEGREADRQEERGEADLDVPDPYYGGEDGFDRVFDICLAGCRALLAHIRRARRTPALPDGAPPP